MGDYQNNSKIDLVQAVTSENDNSLKQKPYARLKEGYAFKSDETGIKDYLVRSCKNRGIWPIEILLEQFNEKELLEAIDYITDNGDRAKFDPPRTLSKLRTEKSAYFAGVAAGDGGFNGPKTWSVVDGGKEHQLEHSQEFIEEISRIMQDLFGFEKKSIWINKKDNRIELKITNKWFSRYIRHVFGLPKSYKKGKLSRPDIFQSQENIAAFWRGLFDTDGSVSSNSYRISMGTATESFAKECLEDLKSIGLSAKFRNATNGYEIRVDTTEFEEYCTRIGFSHPRKREMILSKLQRGSRNYVYEGRSTEILDNMYYDLTSLEDLRVIGFGDQIYG